MKLLFAGIVLLAMVSLQASAWYYGYNYYPAYYSYTPSYYYQPYYYQTPTYYYAGNYVQYYRPQQYYTTTFAPYYGSSTFPSGFNYYSYPSYYGGCYGYYC